MNKDKIRKLAYLLNEETGNKMNEDLAWAIAKHTLVKQAFYKNKRCPMCGYKRNKQ